MELVIDKEQNTSYLHFNLLEEKEVGDLFEHTGTISVISIICAKEIKWDDFKFVIGKKIFDFNNKENKISTEKLDDDFAMTIIELKEKIDFKNDDLFVFAQKNHNVAMINLFLSNIIT